MFRQRTRGEMIGNHSLKRQYRMTCLVMYGVMVQGLPTCASHNGLSGSEEASGKQCFPFTRHRVMPGRAYKDLPRRHIDSRNER